MDENCISIAAEGRKEYTSDTKHPSHAGSSILTFEFTVRDMNFSEPHEFTSKVKSNVFKKILLFKNDCRYCQKFKRIFP